MDEQEKLEDQQKRFRLPKQRGQYSDVKRFSDLSSQNTVRFHDEGERPLAPHRDDVGSGDPTFSGMLSVAQKAECNEPIKNPSYETYEDEKPQQVNPYTIQNFRPSTAAIHRKGEPLARLQVRAKSAVSGPFSWQNRKETENVLRGKTIFSGWRDEYGDTRNWEPTERSKEDARVAEIWSNDIIKNMVYKSSTQRAFEEVNWDSKLPTPIKAPDTTVEPEPDPITERLKAMKIMKEKTPKEWQAVAKGWDYFQKRNQHLHEKRPYSFCSPSKRTYQIPNYGGHISGEGDIDNTWKGFLPLTVKRNNVPTYYGTGRSQNIPGYTGNVWWLGVISNHCEKPASASQVTHTPFPKSASNVPQHGLSGNMSKTISQVPPCNPFVRSQREELVVDPMNKNSAQASPLENVA